MNADDANQEEDEGDEVKEKAGKEEEEQIEAGSPPASLVME